MFYPEKMSRVTIAAPKSSMKRIIDVLYELKALHIEEYVPRKLGDLPVGSPLSEAERISELLIDIHSLKAQMPAAQPKTKARIQKPRSFIRKLKSSLESRRKRIKEIGESIKEGESRLSELEFLAGCGITDPRVLSEYRTLSMFSGYVAKPENLKVEGAAVFAGSGKPAPVVVFARKENAEKISRALEKARFTEHKIRLRPSGKLSSEIGREKKNIEDLQREKSVLEAEIQKIMKDSSAAINGIERALLEKVEQAESPLMFASGEYVFIIQGWVPQKNSSAVVERVREINPNIYIKVEEAKKHAPTKMKNPRPVQPFEFFLSLYSLPKYNEIDPSFLIFVSFPLFYGMMLGDIGYGLVLLLLATVLRFKMRKMRAVMDVTILSALSTITFGFVFGEFFGSEQLLGYHLVPLLHRLEHVDQLIMASAFLGLLHVNAGILIGFVNELKTHGMKQAVTAKLSWFVLEAGVILFALNQLNYASTGVYIPAGLVVVSIIGLLIGEGFRGIIEIPSLVANVLSYLRLTAIGLASASLALVVNGMAGSLFAGDAISVAVGVFVLVIGHTINLALGIIDSFLQSLRLHYVELFTKFYHGAGKPYKPFGSGRK